MITIIIAVWVITLLSAWGLLFGVKHNIVINNRAYLGYLSIFTAPVAFLVLAGMFIAMRRKSATTKAEYQNFVTTQQIIKSNITKQKDLLETVTLAADETHGIDRNIYHTEIVNIKQKIAELENDLRVAKIEHNKSESSLLEC